MESKAREMLHNLVLEVMKDHTKIIQKAITASITPATNVSVKVDKDDNDTEAIIVVFDNSVIRYTASVDLDTYINTCLDYSIYTAIVSVIVNTLKGFTDVMFDIYFKPASEVDKILKNIK